MSYKDSNSILLSHLLKSSINFEIAWDIHESFEELKRRIVSEFIRLIQKNTLDSLTSKGWKIVQCEEGDKKLPNWGGFSLLKDGWLLDKKQLLAIYLWVEDGYIYCGLSTEYEDGFEEMKKKLKASMEAGGWNIDGCWDESWQEGDKDKSCWWKYMPSEYKEWPHTHYNNKHSGRALSGKQFFAELIDGGWMDLDNLSIRKDCPIAEDYSKMLGDLINITEQIKIDAILSQVKEK